MKAHPDHLSVLGHELARCSDIRLRQRRFYSQCYQPALLGSLEWIWFPSWVEFRTIYLSNLAFKTGLIQLPGGMTFSMASVAGFPDVVDVTNPANLLLVQGLIFFPQVLGGSCFMVSGIILMLVAQEKWYAAKFCNLNWQAAFWSTNGAICFLIARALRILAPAAVFAVVVAVLLGSWLFLLGSILQWYLLMEHYPGD